LVVLRHTNRRIVRLIRHSHSDCHRKCNPQSCHRCWNRQKKSRRLISSQCDWKHRNQRSLQSHRRRTRLSQGDQKTLILNHQVD
jgi:hypothetical protein